MRHFVEPNRDQLIMLKTVDLRSAAPVGSVVHTIDRIVDSLDTTRFEETYDLESEQGQNPIHPRTLIKVCLYALHNCRFSTRKMEEDTIHNLGYMFLTGERSIDHTTFSKFLTRFKEEILDLFSQIVMFCAEEGLVDFDVLAIDSVKIRANASYKQAKNKKALKKEEAKIRARLDELISKVDKSEEESQEYRRLRKRLKRVDRAARILKERLASISAGRRSEARIEEKLKVNVTDPDAHIMEYANGGKNPSYSVTTTTDTNSDIITHFQVNLQDDDAEALIPAIEGSQEKTGQAHNVNVADASFCSLSNLEELEGRELNALIPDRRLEVERLGLTAKGDYDRSKFEYDAVDDRYKCPQGQYLVFVGKTEANGRSAQRYANSPVCAECQVKAECTRGVYRTVTRDDKEAVRERMREKLSLKENREIYNLRAHAAEAPYGCIKWNWKVISMMRRGIGKVGMEFALIFSLHNLLKLGAVWCT